MKGWRKGRGEWVELETELRANRPKPQGDFLRALAKDVDSHGRRPRQASSFRLAFAGALTMSMLVVFGGLGWAANNKPSDDTRPGWGCGDKNHTHTGPPGNPYATNPCKPGSPGNP